MEASTIIFSIDRASLNDISPATMVLIIAGSIMLLGAILSLAHHKIKKDRIQ